MQRNGRLCFMAGINPERMRFKGVNCNTCGHNDRAGGRILLTVQYLVMAPLDGVSKS